MIACGCESHLAKAVAGRPIPSLAGVTVRGRPEGNPGAEAGGRTQSRIAYDPLTAPDAADRLALEEGERLRLVEAYHRRAGVLAPEPTVHATLHTIVESQVAADDPSAVRRALARVMKEGLDRHEAIHAIAWALTNQLHQVANDRTDFSTANYEAALDDLTESRRRAATEGEEDD